MANINLMDLELAGAEIVGADMQIPIPPGFFQWSKARQAAYQRLKPQQKMDLFYKEMELKKAREQAAAKEQKKIKAAKIKAAEEQARQDVRNIDKAKTSAAEYKRSIKRIKNAFDNKDLNLLNKRVKEGSAVLEKFKVPKTPAKAVNIANPLRTQLSQMVKEGKQIVKEVGAHGSAAIPGGSAAIPGGSAPVPGGMGLLIPIAAAGVGALLLLK